MAPAPTALAAGMTEHVTPVSVGVTAFAPAVPLFFTARVTVNTWPVSAVVTLGVRIPDNPAGVWIVTDAVAAGIVTAPPVFASVPLAVALRLRVPALADEHVWYTKFTVLLPPTAAAAGTTEQVTPVSTGVTAFAPAVPEFFTAKVTVKAWPVSAVVTLGVRIPESAAGVCTVTEAVAAGMVTVAPVFASVPLAVALRLRVPALADEQVW